MVRRRIFATIVPLFEANKLLGKGKLSKDINNSDIFENEGGKKQCL